MAGGNTVDVHINGSENVSGVVAKVKAALESLKGEDITIKVDADTSKALAKIESLKGKDVTLNVDADTGAALAKINSLDNKDLSINVDANTSEARSKINSISDRDVTINVDSDTGAARANIDSILSNRSVTININANTIVAESQIATVARNRRSTVTVDVDRSALGKIGSLLAGIVSGVGGFATGINKGIAAASRGIPVIGGLTRAVAGLGNPVASGAAAFLTLGAAATAASGVAAAGIYAVQAALGTVAGVAGLAGAAIGGGFIAGFTAIVAKSEEVTTAFDGLENQIGETFQAAAAPVKMPVVEAIGALRSAFDQVAPSIQRIGEGTGRLITDLSGKLPAVAQRLGPMLESAFDFGSKSLGAFADELPNIVGGIDTFFQKLSSPGSMRGIEKAFGALPGLISGAGSAIAGLSSGFDKVTNFVNSGAIDGLKDGFSDFLGNLGNTDFSGLTGGIADMANAFGNFMGSLDTQGISDFFGNIASGTADVTNAFTAVGEGIGSVNEKIQSFGSLIEDGFEDIGLGKGKSLMDRLLGDENWDPNRWLNDHMGFLGDFEEDNPIEAKVPIEISPEVLNEGGFDAIASQIEGIKDLPPVQKVQSVEAIFELAENGDITNSQLAGLLDRVDLGTLEPVQVIQTVEMTLEAARNGDLNSGQIADVVDDLNLEDLPPIEKAQAVEVVYEMHSQGLLNDADFARALEFLGELPPLTLNQAATIKTIVDDVIPPDVGALTDLAAAGGESVTIPVNALMEINQDPGTAERQLRQYISGLTGIPPQNVDLKIIPNPVVDGALEVPLLPPLPKPAPQDLDTPVNIIPSLAGIKQDSFTFSGIFGNLTLPLIDVPQPVIVTPILQSVGPFDLILPQMSPAPQTVPVPVIPMPFLDSQGGGFQVIIPPLPPATPQTVPLPYSVIPQLNGSLPTPTVPQLPPAPKQTIVQPFDLLLEQSGGATPANFKGIMNTATGAAAGKGLSPIKQTVTVDVIPNTAALDAALGGLGGTKQITVMIIPNISAVMAALGGLSGGIPVTVNFVANTAGLMGALAVVSSIATTIQVNFTANTAGVMGALAVISSVATTITVNFVAGPLPVIAIPPVNVPVNFVAGALPIFNIPPVSVTVTFNMGAIPTIPNTTSTHTIVVNAPPLPSYPNTTSTHTVMMNAPASTPSYPNTSSTHTVNIVVNGAGAARAAVAAASASLPSGALNKAASLPMGASIPMGASGAATVGSSGASSVIYRAGRNIATGISNGIMSGTKTIASSVNALMDQANQIISQNSDFKSANELGKNLANSVASGISAGQSLVDQSIKEVNSSVQQAVSNFKSSNPELVSAVENTQKVFQGLSTVAGVARNALAQIAAEELQLPPMDQVVAKAKEIGGNIGKALVGDPTALQTNMEQLGSALSSKVTSISTKVGAAATQINQSLVDNVPGYSEMLAKGAEIGNGIQSGINQANVQAGQFFAPIVQAAETAKNQAKAAFDALAINVPKPVIPAPNINPVTSALAQIPGAIDTVNRVTSNADQVIRDINAIPEVANTRNIIDSNVKAAEAAIQALNGENTSSQHTVRVVTQGSSAPGGGNSSSRGAATPFGSALGDFARSAGIARGAGGLGSNTTASVGGSASAAMFAVGQSISIGIARGIESEISSITAAAAGINLAVLGSLSSDGYDQAFLNGKQTALGYAAGMKSEYGKIQTVGKLMGNTVYTGSQNTILADQHKQMQKLNKSLNAWSSSWLFLIPIIGPLLALGAMFARPGIERKAWETAPTAKGVTNYYYYHYDSTTNNFDGGLVGDMEAQGRRVLDVLEQSPDTRRIRKVFRS